MSNARVTPTPTPAASPLAEEDIVVRELRAEDLDRIVRIDRHATGNERRDYYKRRLQMALAESGIRVSLAAEVDGTLVGFVLGRVFHGEYGRTESYATIDSIGVDPAFRTRGIGHALLAQLQRNLTALRVERVETTVDWDAWELLRFLQATGFRPAPRLALELQL